MNEQSPKQPAEPYVFVSFDQADASKVREEVAWLKSEGISFWPDEAVASGEAEKGDLKNALDDAAKVLFYVSNASLASDACRREVAMASLRGLEILQVFLEEGGLTEEVQDSHHLGRVFQMDESAAHRSELVRALKEQVLARG